jgi:hypothetical protein
MNPSNPSTPNALRDRLTGLVVFRPESLVAPTCLAEVLTKADSSPVKIFTEIKGCLFYLHIFN